MSKNAILLTLLLAGTASAASTCEELRTQIEAKIRANGVAGFSVSVVDAGASAPGRVVGSCDRGARKIVYVQHRPAGAGPSGDAAQERPNAPGKREPAPMLTECADGTVKVNGDCRK
jgi:Protein of unknown function (DUF1161)